MVLAHHLRDMGEVIKTVFPSNRLPVCLFQLEGYIQCPFIFSAKNFLN